MAPNPAQLHGIKDNHRRGRVADFLSARIAQGSRLSVVSAYFTIYAYDALREQLDGVDSLRFLFGEPRFIQALDPEKTDKKAFKIEDEGLELANRLQQKDVARRCAEWIRDKVEIRSVREANLLHGKLYHVDDGKREHALMGSSNFTRRGLGLSATPNIELNMVVDSDRDRADLKAWFDELWADTTLVEDVKARVLEYLAQLHVDHAPEFIYFKTLFHVFEKFLSGQQESAQFFENTAITDTEIWRTLFDFQKDGVKGAIQKINMHNGCILADSVGLGKTYSALAVIKFFELRNHCVLVLCPKKLRENWTVYLAQNASELNSFVRDRFAYTVLSHTDLSRETGKAGDIDLAAINWGNFDLIVIDESHNFRNNVKGKRDEEGMRHCLPRYLRTWFPRRFGAATTKAGIPAWRAQSTIWPITSDRAAGVYARAAFEGKLKKYCEDKHVAVEYKSNHALIATEMFWKGIKDKLSWDGKLGAVQSQISAIEAHRKVVLNPLSHEHPTTLTEAEIRGAITAIEDLDNVLK